MKKYRLDIREEIGGFMDILAESEEDARDKAQELMDKYGLDRLFYGESFPRSVGLRHWKHTHGQREVLGCEEKPYFLDEDGYRLIVQGGGHPSGPMSHE